MGSGNWSGRAFGTVSNLRAGDETSGRVKRKFRAVATRSVHQQQRASRERQLQATDRGCRRQTKKMNVDRNVLSSNGDHQKVRAHPCPVRCGVRRARLRKGTANRSNHSATEARSRRTLRYERLRAATATIRRCARALAPFVAACVARTRERERSKASWERTQQARRRQLRRWSQVPLKASADAAAQSVVLKGARALLQELLSDGPGV